MKERLDLLLKSHIQALVKLIDDQECQLLNIYVALGNMIVDASGGAEDDLRTLLAQYAMLVHGGATSVDSHRSEARADVLQHSVGL